MGSSAFYPTKKIKKMAILIITPKTKVGELLEAYPELEETLIELAPVFKKLKNPVLRRTIARVTTLQQASTVGNIPVHRLVNTLRQIVGQGELEGLESGPGKEQLKPSWFDEKNISKRLDARPIIEQGGHPLGEVLNDLKDFGQGQIYELRTPFVPAPMLERLMAQGFDVWTVKEAEESFVSYFTLRVSGTEHP
jgi:hypothetical protein